MTRINLIRPRGGTAALWTSVNPVLAVRELGVETDTLKQKLGDGSTAWVSLPYMSQPASAYDATGTAVAQRAATNVLTLGVKGDVVTVTDAAITAATTALSSASAAFTSADVGKRVQVVGAAASYNNRGAWAASTAYVSGDLVTFGGNTYIARAGFTSGTAWTTNNWGWLTYGQTAQTLLATILSVSGGVATLDVAATNTVSGATCTYGTDDSPIVTALGAGDYYFPGGRTYFLSDWFMSSNTTVTSAGATFKVPYYTSTDLAPFRLLTSNRTLTSMLSNIHLRGKFAFDMTELTPPTGTNPRGVHVLNCQDWSVDHLVGVGLPGTTGNVMQTGTNSGGAMATRGRIQSIRNTVIRGIGSSCVQMTGGVDLTFGSLIADSGVPCRFELDNNVTIGDNITVDLVHSSGAGLFANAAVFWKAHDSALRNVTIRNVFAEGTADGLAMSYTNSGSVTNSTIQHMRVTGGGQAVNITATGMTFAGVVIREAVCVSPASTGFNRNATILPGVGFCVAPGMTLYSPTCTGAATNGIRDISQASIVTGTTVRIYDALVTGSTFNGIQIDKTEIVTVMGGRLSSNGTWGATVNTGCILNLFSVDTRSNTSGATTGTGTANATAF